MSEKFEDFVKHLTVDTLSIEDAARYYLSEKYGVTQTDMRNQLEAITSNSRVVAAAGDYLVQHPQELERIFRELLKWAWDQKDDATIVARAIGAANQKLGVLDHPSYAILAMYALWILSTHGVVTTETTSKHADGSTQSVKVIYADPPLVSLLDLIERHLKPEEEPNRPPQEPPILPQKQVTKKPLGKVPKQ